MAGTRTFKLRDFIQALRLNGYTQRKNRMVHYNVDRGDKLRIESACAFGQAALNLGVDPDMAYRNMDKGKIGEYVMIHNDDYYGQYTCEQIADMVEQTFAEDLDNQYEAPTRDWGEYEGYQGVKV